MLRSRSLFALLAFSAAAAVAVAAHADDKKPAQSNTLGEVVRLDPRLDKLLPTGARMEILAYGFDWTEGPVWVPRDGGFLLFSDIPRNSIFRWKEGQGVSLFVRPAGYTGSEPWGPEPGTNGLLLDPEGRLVMCEHGNRRVTRLDQEKDCIKTVLASHYLGKRLNSPNDAVFKSGGDLYFTDPPYGLPKQYDDPRRELDWCGVYRLTPKGELTLLTKEMTRPNGIGLSPDEKTLYVAQSDPAAAIWRAFPVKQDGTLGDGTVFHDATEKVGKVKGLPDGLSVDVRGNVFATGPGGVLIFDPDGTLLGVLETGEATANCEFGGKDGTDLFITADMYILRIKTTTQGLNFDRPPLKK
ncbi:MAG: SMP-30/gluconolactonase/LRE family protein [Planctomycetia bacterium]|nr:SMP-30/gluconolactonase/LRE family protein [Planctomycetia bacterium]